MLNRYFGSYSQRQLLADHINDNKDVYIDHIEEISANTLRKIKKNWVE